jgi:hypothetical protein
MGQVLIPVGHRALFHYYQTLNLYLQIFLHIINR